MDINEARRRLLQNKEFRKAYYKLDLPFEMSKMVISARIKRDVTQAKLAKIIKTGQSSIARVEKGNVIPTLGMLQKIAEALKMILLPPLFVPAEEITVTTEIKEVDNTNFFSKSLEPYTPSSFSSKSKRSGNSSVETYI